MTDRLNRRAVAAVCLHAHNPADARLLLDVLGLLDGDRIAPDDCRVYNLDPHQPARDDSSDPYINRRDKTATPPPGLARLWEEAS